MRLTSLKTLIKADTKKMLTEDWGGSDEGVLLNSMHKDLRNPQIMTDIEIVILKHLHINIIKNIFLFFIKV